MIAADWDTLPRMLHELCDGHPQVAAEVYALDLPNGQREWLCWSCWVRRRRELAKAGVLP